MKKATFKGATKYAIRHKLSGKYYNSARYAKGLCDTPSFKSDEAEMLYYLQNMCKDEHGFYAKEYGVKMNIAHFEIVTFILVETDTLTGTYDD